MAETANLEEIARSRGAQYEANFHGCAQCTIAGIQDALGRRDDEVFKSASGLAAGISKFGDGSCGAYIASVMMFGLIFGRSRDNFAGDKENLNRVYELTRKMRTYFLDRYGSIDCAGVQKSIFGRSFNIWDNEEKKNFEEAGAHTNKCTSVVGDAAAYAIRLIYEEQKQIEKAALQD